MTLRPDQLQATQAQAAIAAGVTRQQLTDAAAVAALFNIITRYANARRRSGWPSSRRGTS
jgi:alkylhydroperoxidase/carboxymuconolactone decarboxylase family protein YurZ